MRKQAQAAALEWRLRRIGGEYERASIRYVTSPKALQGLVVTWASAGFYLHRAGQWRWIGRNKAAASLRINGIENGEKIKPPPPTPAEVFGVVLQVIGAALGIVREIRR